MGTATLILDGKQVLDFETGNPIKIQFEGEELNELQKEKLKKLKTEIKDEVEKEPSGFGADTDDALGRVFSFPTTIGARTAYQAANDIISNVAAFGFDVAAFFTKDDEKKEKLESTSEKIRNFAPDVKDLSFFDFTSGEKTGETIGEARPIQQNIEDLVATGLQYGSPALAVTKVTNLSKLPRVPRYLTNVLGVSASDVAVTDPDKAVTIADVFGANKLPTKIDEDDSNLEKRLKVGAESLGIITGVDATGKAISSVIPKTIKDSATAPFSGEKQKELLAESFAENIYLSDPEKFPTNIYKKGTKLPDDVTNELIQNIDEAVETGSSVGAKMTTGTASKNVGLIALEKGVATAKNTSSALVNRQIENANNMMAELDKTLKIKDTKNIAEFVEETSTNLQFERNLKTELETLVNEAKNETDNLINTFKVYGKKDPSLLSVNIDSAIKKDLENLVSTKNRLFNNIDPTDSVILNKLPLKNALSKTLIGEGKITPVSQPIQKIITGVLNKKDSGSILTTLKKLADPKNKTKLTYNRLSKIRPIITSKINAYAKQDDANGEVVKRLAELKNVINKYADDLVNNKNTVVANKAKNAMNYYKNIFTPAFKTGVGRIFRDNIIKGRNDFPSSTASKFIIGKPIGGSKETINQLNKIINRASKTDDVQANLLDDVNDYLLYQFAQKVTGKNNKTNLDSVNRFIENHRQILNTPQFNKANNVIQGAKRELQVQGNKILSNNKKLQDLQKTVSLREKDIAYKALSNLIDQDPQKFVQATLRLPLEKALKTIREAKALVKGNDMAEQGLKDAYIDYAYDALTKGSGNSLTNDIITTSVNRFDNFLRGDVEKIYQEILGKSGLDTIRKVHTTLKTFNNLNIKAVTDSGTASLLAQTLNNSRLFLASIYGIIRGGAIFRISELLSSALGIQPKATMEQLLVKSFLDPELGKEILKRANKQTINPYAAKMRLYILNNLPTISDNDNRPRKYKLAE